MTRADCQVELDVLAAALPGLAGDSGLAEAAAELAGIGSDGDFQDDLFRTAAIALADALASTKSPAVFADAAGVFMTSPTLLEAAGARLAGSVLEQASPPHKAATDREILRAADALDIATQLRLGGWAPRWDLFALLSSFGGGPEPYARAVLRAVLACVEQWTEAADLVPVARRVAGLDYRQSSAAESAPTPTGPDEGAVSPSDAGVALARMSIMGALRASDPANAVGHLDDAISHLGAVLEHDDRVDARIVDSISKLIRGLIVNQHVDRAAVAALTDNVREFRHLSAERGHWAGDVSAATWLSWARLSIALGHAQELFSEPSWLRAVDVIHDLVDLYRGTSSTSGFRRDEDGHAVAALVGPVVEAGFASEVALMHHLKVRVAELEASRDEGTASEEELADLLVAIDIRDAAERRIAAGIPVRPKAAAGTELPAEQLGDDAGLSAAEGRVWSVVARRRHREQLATASNVVNETLRRVWDDLEEAEDYVRSDAIAEAVDLMTSVLVYFLWDRNAVGPSEAAYLFDIDASEEDLARDLRQFFRARGYLYGVDTEIRHVGGGRVDVRFAFPGFNLYVELKQDIRHIPVTDKASYLGQAAAYQVGEPRIGFLLVLKHTPRKTPAAHIEDSVEVVTVTDAAGKPRHVVVFTLSGSRTVPSGM